ncbi:SIS domain-containing protein [Thalassobacillus pellis]|uniref:SIS domain-containing protein n=1 Tax=Thalassobacillus pellis TaxID=748008 RepID=UPI0019602C92|nr:SIS domain-containing protein [Thalassobacillus pellis]MBM7551574.1 glucosamine--fructose-6-phosphate aminotransferase (isomerizing) [Thalassobacillus pellis]
METYTWKEITEQDHALKLTYEVMDKKKYDGKRNYDVFVFTGCGTSFYLAHSAAKYFQKTTGKTAIAVPSSEIFMDFGSVFSEHYSYQLIVISRSGTTSEAVKALEYVKDIDYIDTLAITCNQSSDSGELSDEVILLDHINEKSVVMTQSFSSMLYALQLYAAHVGGKEIKKKELSKIPDLSSSLMKKEESLKALANDTNYKRFIYLGASVFNGIAKEATLKIKEMTQTECESYSNLEFRHGPISIVDSSTVVVLLTSETSEAYDSSLVTDIKNKGAKVVVLKGKESQVNGDTELLIPGDAPSDEAAALYMPYLQLLAFYKAKALGLNPDEPRNLTQVVKLKI